MTHLSLFSGIGGLDLAAEQAAFETVGQCEWAEYPTEVLKKHWPNVARWKDIRTLTGDSFFEKTGLRTVDIISGGFPCQPFSVSGKQKGKDDDRYLWPEMLRVIKELRPRWIIAENVAGLVRIALDEVLQSLQDAGYTARAYAFKASSVGALFAGDRIAIVASPNDGSAIMRRDAQLQPNESALCSGSNNRRGAPQFDTGQWREIESRPYGVADGVPNRVDRLKCLGNAVVPAQFYPIFKSIAEIQASL